MVRSRLALLSPAPGRLLLVRLPLEVFRLLLVHLVADPWPVVSEGQHIDLERPIDLSIKNYGAMLEKNRSAADPPHEPAPRETNRSVLPGGQFLPSVACNGPGIAGRQQKALRQ